MKLALLTPAFLASIALARPSSPYLDPSSPVSLPRRDTPGDPRITRLFDRRAPQAQNPPGGATGLTSTGYPPEDVKGPTPKPAWVQAYQAAKSAGLIPTFAPSVLGPTGNPVYSGVDGNSATVCSWTVSKCTNGECVRNPRSRSGAGIPC